jgi:AcrR family transcriptional regulator
MNQVFEPTASGETKDRILDAAERLFADQGFAATSLRQITADARVNLAAVNYHFKSKESLLSAVIERTLSPINRRRIELLDELEASSTGAPPRLEAVVQAFVRPAFEARIANPERTWHFPRLMARLLAEPDDWAAPVMLPALHEITRRFMPIFQQAMGVESRTTVLWGVQFAIGCMTRCLVAPAFIHTITGDAVPSESMEQTLDRLVCFIVGGMQALAESESSL